MKKHNLYGTLNTVANILAFAAKNNYRVNYHLPGVVSVLTNGDQVWGSGGYSVSSSILAGSPETQSYTEKVGQFVSMVWAKVEMKEGDAIVVIESDCVGEGRTWKRIHLCVSPKDLPADHPTFANARRFAAMMEEIAACMDKVSRAASLRAMIQAQGGRTGGRARERLHRARMELKELLDH
jgi:hypothetical protein